MNKRGTTSVNAVLDALPFGMGDDLLLLSVFGSQVRGTERPDSDLDILFVVRTSEASRYKAIYDTVTGTPGGVGDATIIPHIPETIARTANVYGTVEWGALREEGAITLWRSPDFGVELHRQIDYRYGARRWLEMAEDRIFPEGGGEPDHPALDTATGYLLRACLLAAGVRFPYTRDVRELYGMIPSGMRPRMEIDAVAAALEGGDAAEPVRRAYRSAHRVVAAARPAFYATDHPTG